MTSSAVWGAKSRGVWVALAAVLGTLVHEPRAAEACGCLSPPAVTSGDYAVNQSAEQIIFEVEPGWVTAHVLIRYAGKPESFAWIVPVPEIPELALSPASAFGLLDKATTPIVNVTSEDLCPRSAWSCNYHQQPHCNFDSYGAEDSPDGAGGGSFADAGAGGQPPPVTVIDEKVVGDYQTVTFRANEAAAATQWLRTNGFIVNQTTSIYMEPYVQANMVFVAAKLLPGAGVASIKPLRMKYRAAFPMVPLLLTAVAADPHMTVTSYLYGDEAFRPMGHPTIKIDPNKLARDPQGRTNYPMVLARGVDEAGGDGFVTEYLGAPIQPNLGQSSCCTGGYDFCNVGNNNQCECPGSTIDQADCSTQTDLVDGIKLLEDLAEKHTTLTRLTTRVSPEEMRFDPTYERDYATSTRPGRLQLQASQPSLARCETQIIDKASYAQIEAKEACSSLYCGVGGQCVTTAGGAACACAAGNVAQQFTDLDGKQSVTCVPRVPTVDLRAGGEQLPNACATVTCGAGTCIDRNGVAVCECADNMAARAGSTTPRCEAVRTYTQTPGAADFSEPLRALDVCAPPPPTCGEGGWLVKTGTNRPGVNCGGTEPSAWKTEPPPKPVCDGFFGCAGCQQGTSAPLPAVAMAWIVAALVLRRRRRGPAA